MNVVALVCWVAAAFGGFYLLATWLQSGGMRQQHHGPTRFPAVLVFGHFAFAAAGMLVWLAYLFDQQQDTAALALTLIVVTALTGLVLFARWLPGQLATLTPARSATSQGGAGHAGGTRGAEEPAAEQTFPLATVVGHGVLAALTLVLVLVITLGS